MWAFQHHLTKNMVEQTVRTLWRCRKTFGLNWRLSQRITIISHTFWVLVLYTNAKFPKITQWRALIRPTTRGATSPAGIGIPMDTPPFHFLVRVEILKVWLIIRKGKATLRHNLYLLYRYMVIITTKFI